MLYGSLRCSTKQTNSLETVYIVLEMVYFAGAP